MSCRSPYEVVTRYLEHQRVEQAAQRPALSLARPVVPARPAISPPTAGSVARPIAVAAPPPRAESRWANDPDWPLALSSLDTIFAHPELKALTVQILAIFAQQASQITAEAEQRAIREAGATASAEDTRFLERVIEEG
jgi:hypothetical protein